LFFKNLGLFQPRVHHNTYFYQVTSVSDQHFLVSFCMDEETDTHMRRDAA